MFWGLYAIDRELIFPKSLDEFIPGWQNHVMHTLPIIGALLDAYLVHHSFPKFRNGIKLTIGFISTYLGT